MFFKKYYLCFMQIVNTAFFRFRLRQFGKIIRELPVPYLLILSVMVTFAMLALYSFAETLKGAVIIGITVLLLLLLFHRRRKDYHFIQMVEKKPWRVFCMDYLLLSLPVLLIEIIQGFYVLAIGMGVGCMLIGFIKQPIHRANKGTTPPCFIPGNAFEYRAGIRQYGILMLIIYGSAYVGLLFPYISLVSLWLFTCIQSDFFRYSEPTSILCVQEFTGKQFLHSKLWLYIRIYETAIIPVCLLYTILYPEQWWLVLILIVYGTADIALIIISKYAAYQPNTKITAGQVAISLSLFGILLPILFPLTLFYIIKKYIAARRNLTSYLYAYN